MGVEEGARDKKRVEGGVGSKAGEDRSGSGSTPRLTSLIKVGEDSGQGDEQRGHEGEEDSNSTGETSGHSAWSALLWCPAFPPDHSRPPTTRQKQRLGLLLSPAYAKRKEPPRFGTLYIFITPLSSYHHASNLCSVM